jgi:hypothetical protein
MAGSQITTKPMPKPGLIWAAWLLLGAWGAAFGADSSRPSTMNARRDDELAVSTGVVGGPRAFPPEEAAREAFFEESKAKAEEGNAAAQYDLGIYYLGGMGVVKDPSEAASVSQGGVGSG